MNKIIQKMFVISKGIIKFIYAVGTLRGPVSDEVRVVQLG